MIYSVLVHSIDLGRAVTYAATYSDNENGDIVIESIEVDSEDVTNPYEREALTDLLENGMEADIAYAFIQANALIGIRVLYIP